MASWHKVMGLPVSGREQNRQEIRAKIVSFQNNAHQYTPPPHILYNSAIITCPVTDEFLLFFYVEVAPDN